MIASRVNPTETASYISSADRLKKMQDIFDSAVKKYSIIHEAHKNSFPAFKEALRGFVSNNRKLIH